MPAPDIILPAPYVLITQTASQLGINALDNNIQFGLVELAYDTSDRVQAGQYVMYDPKMAKVLIYGSTIYQLIKDEFVSGQEVIPP